MCHEELALNARLAPDLYLAVKAVAAHARELEITDELIRLPSTMWWRCCARSDPARRCHGVVLRHGPVGGTRAAADHVGVIDSPQTDMFSSIVWATDGAGASLAGSRFVRETCERYGSRLRIVHVAPTLCTAADERRIASLKALTSSLRRHDIDASLHVVRGAIGSPAPHIAEVARMSRAKLVIVGTRGRSGGQRGCRKRRATPTGRSAVPGAGAPGRVRGHRGRRPAVTPALAASA